MSNLSSKQVKDIQSLYESIYKENVLTEEQQNEILIVEWYNLLVEDGVINGDKIVQGEYTVEGIWDKIAKYGPKAMSTLSKVTGFGAGPGRGAATRRIATTAAFLQPIRTWNTVSGAVTGAVQGFTKPAGGGPIDAASRAIQAAQGKSVPAADDKKKNNGSGTTTWSTPSPGGTSR